MNNNLKTQVEEAIETLEYEIASTKWILPRRSNALVIDPNGHLSVVHTKSLIELKNLLHSILEGE